MRRPTKTNTKVFDLTGFLAAAFWLAVFAPALAAAESPQASDDQVIVEFGSSSIWIATRDLLHNDGLSPDLAPSKVKVVFGQPAHGKVEGVTKTGFQYTPDPGAETFGSDSFTYTLLEDENVAVESTATVLVIFDGKRVPELDEGFEAGDAGSIELASPRLEVTPAAAITGSWGLRVTVPSAGGDAYGSYRLFGGDGQDSGGVAVKLRCPDALTGFPDGVAVDVLQLGWWLGAPGLRVEVRKLDGRLELSAVIQDDFGTEHLIAQKWQLDDSAHRLRIDWWRGADGEPEGMLALWIDGVLAGRVDNLVNGSVDLIEHRFGLLGLTAMNAEATLDFDDIEVWS